MSLDVTCEAVRTQLVVVVIIPVLPGRLLRSWSCKLLESHFWSPMAEDRGQEDAHVQVGLGYWLCEANGSGS